MNNPETIMQGAVAVGSSAVLGCWSLLIFCVINVSAFVWLFVDMIKFHRDSIKNIKRENAGKHDNPNRITLQNPRGCKLLVSYLEKITRLLIKPINLLRQCYLCLNRLIAFARLFAHRGIRRTNCLSYLLKIVHKRKRPNDPKLSHDDRAPAQTKE